MYAWGKFEPQQQLFAVSEFIDGEEREGEVLLQKLRADMGRREENWCYQSRAGKTGWQDAGYKRAWGGVLATQLQQSQSPVA